MRPFNPNADVVDFVVITPASDQIAQYIGVDMAAGVGCTFWWQFANAKLTKVAIFTGLDQLLFSGREIPFVQFLLCPNMCHYSSLPLSPAMVAIYRENGIANLQSSP